MDFSFGDREESRENPSAMWTAESPCLKVEREREESMSSCVEEITREEAMPEHVGREGFSKELCGQLVIPLTRT